MNNEAARPSTRGSNGSNADAGSANTGGSIGSKVGSVRKRLSMMGIGKKASKSSVRSRGQVESLPEE